MNKKLNVVFITIISFVLVGCSGSKSIQKTWKVSNASGDSYIMEIKEKEIIISENKTNGRKESMKYTQNAVGISNGVKYCGITVDEENYSIVFPEKGNENLALFLKIKGEDYLDGSLKYAMNVKEEPNYMEYGVKYLH